jgi:hypothetical protein
MAAAMLLMVPGATGAKAQSNRVPWAKPEPYQVLTTYDRLADSTRVTVVLEGGSRPTGLGSRAWLDASFSYSGAQLTAPPEEIVLTLESFTPARGGWAFSRRQKLRVRSGKSLQLEVPNIEYVRLPVGLFDSGRREALSFRIPAERLAALLTEPELEFKAGNAKIRFRQENMEMLREMVRRMTLSGPQPR